jgi:hypothetical protein
MSAARLDLTIERGADKRFALQIKDSSGVPITLSADDSFSAEVREAHRKPLVAEFHTDKLTPLTNGKISLILTREDTLLLSSARQYQWDLFWTRDPVSAEPVTRRLLYGTVDVEANITQTIP